VQRLSPCIKKHMRKSVSSISIFLLCGIVLSSSLQAQPNPEISMRGLADTVGYAHWDWQMDSLMARINSLNQDDLIRSEQAPGTVWKTAICPHDDYTYAGWLYQAVLRNITTQTVIIFGVAHKARSFNLENQLVFDSFKFWHGPYGPVKVSALRDEIISPLPADMAIIHDRMQTVEHSVEALIPFLQYQNRNIEIISILVPYMDFDRMKSISQHLAKVLFAIMAKKNLRWGKDIALLISSDAVHYGDEEWGGNNYAPYGTDSTGNAQAVSHELEIIKTCFEGELTEEKVARFFSYTVNQDDFREYKWTWCGRYSIPFGLLTSLYLQSLGESGTLTGVPVAYATSISQPHLKVDDLGMGQTAIATPHHWVGYPAIGFK
jgi:AmmeMemoRadiSam system protein B